MYDLTQVVRGAQLLTSSNGLVANFTAQRLLIWHQRVVCNVDLEHTTDEAVADRANIAPW